uniref:TerD family protein n=1 Tax=Bacillus safensis TaxID=561879 RepID=UPI0011AABF51
NPAIDQIDMGVGWEVGGEGIDLDREGFVLNEEEKVLWGKDLMYYEEEERLEGGVGDLGDDEFGGGYGENEMMIMELRRV